MLTGLIKPVFLFLKKMPKGKVITYGALARKCGVPNPRNVGWILQQNTEPLKTPCFKVVCSGGRLAKGYKFGGKNGQEGRLRKDGVGFDQRGRVLAEHML